MILFLEKWTMTSGRWTQIKSRWLEEVFMKLGRNVKTCPDRNVWNFPKKSLLTRQIQGGTSSFRWRRPSLSLLSRSHMGGRCREEVSLTIEKPSAKWVIGFFLQTFQTVPMQCNADKLWKPFQCKDFVATCMTATRYFCRSWNQQQKALNVLLHHDCLFPFQDTFLITWSKKPSCIFFWDILKILLVIVTAILIRGKELGPIFIWEIFDCIFWEKTRNCENTLWGRFSSEVGSWVRGDNLLRR